MGKAVWRSRIVGHGEESPDQLLANPLNWRIHPQAQQDALAGVLDEVGWVQDVIVNRRTGHVVDGHMRITLAMRREEKTIPVVYVDLSPEEEAKVLATFDPISAMAATDKEKLDELLREVSTGSEALQALLADTAKDAGLYITPEADDEPPEPPAKAITQPGDLWTLGNHRLFCADSTDAANVATVLDGAEPFLQIVDPPFDLDYDAWTIQPTAKLLYVWARGDKALIWMPTLGLGDEWGVHTLCFTGAARGWARPEQPCLIHEVVYVLRRKGQTAILDKDVVAKIDCEKTSDGRHFSFNPHCLYRDNKMSWAKPVKCFEFALIYTPKDAVVFDPCAGAGGGLLAAERHDRIFRGLEMQPQWCDYIVQRWEKESGQKAERKGLTSNKLRHKMARTDAGTSARRAKPKQRRPARV